MTREEFKNNIHILWGLIEKKAPINLFLCHYVKIFNSNIGFNLRDVDSKDGFLNTNISKKIEDEIESIFEELFIKDIKSSVYTPIEMAEELSSKLFLGIDSLDEIKIKDNINILDVSSGTGNITLELLNYLSNNGLINNINMNCLDVDPLSLRVLKIRSYLRGYKNINILEKDFLSHQRRYDFIISNPPYSGHKDMKMEEKEYFKNKYKGIFNNKSDMYYAYFIKAFELLKAGGRLAFIVSRYFLESLSAQNLREFILENFKIIYIHDYFGDRPFNVGVDPVIIVLQKKNQGVMLNLEENEINEKPYVFEARLKDKKFHCSSSSLSKDSLRPITEKEEYFKKVIYENTQFTLGEIGYFYQGIITGLDKAFIIDEKELKKLNIESKIVYPWIKNKNVRNNNLIADKYIIYPQDLTYDEFYREENLRNHINKFKDLLDRRREVKLNKIPYYKLQWGRKKDLFIQKRIIFSYKNNKSNFIVCENIFHSADIYSYKTDKMDLNILSQLLNSEIYDKYIKLYLKKLGNDLYDYYPNRLSKIRVPMLNTQEELKSFLIKINNLMN